MVNIYTDGSCAPNPGVGGWAFIAELKTRYVYRKGGKKSSTNNEMELQAVIEALKSFRKFKTIIIHTDSNYVIKCATGQWKRNANLDLWNMYDLLTKERRPKFTWVKGHSGDRMNERVDALAKSGRPN